MAERITPEQGVLKLESGDALFVDVRDPASHQEARIPGSVLLNQNNLQDFLAATGRQQSLVVYCYHGHSSQGASDYLTEQGFSTVVSLDGGFEYWRQAHPEHVESE